MNKAVNTLSLSSVVAGSTSWLKGGVLDLKAEVFNEKISADPNLSGKAEVASVFIGQELSTSSMKYTKKVLENAGRLGVDWLLVLLNDCGAHWVGAVVDLKGGTVAFSDSIPVKNRRVFDQLITRLKILCPEKEFTRGENLPTGVQDDAGSCGICSINALEHFLWPREVPLWTSAAKDRLRLEWFIELAERHQSVRVGIVYKSIQLTITEPM